MIATWSVVILLGASTVPDKSVRLVAAGDVMFGRYRPTADGTKFYDRVTASNTPFAGVSPLLLDADIAFANLETPVLTEPAEFSLKRTLTFRAEPTDLDVLAK